MRRRSRPPRRRRRTRKPHLRLVSTLLEDLRHRRTPRSSATAAGASCRFDKGLSIISQHAAGLGYDALILFLDELILWLAMHVGRPGASCNQEAAKLTNLVEAQSVDRPIPIVSFVARQRDLRELIGEHVPGAERLNFGDSLGLPGGPVRHDHPGGPQPAGDRREAGAARCKDEAARQELDAAFEQAARIEGQRDEHPAHAARATARCSARSTPSARPWCRR